MILLWAKNTAPVRDLVVMDIAEWPVGAVMTLLRYEWDAAIPIAVAPALTWLCHSTTQHTFTVGQLFDHPEPERHTSRVSLPELLFQRESGGGFAPTERSVSHRAYIAQVNAERDQRFARLQQLPAPFLRAYIAHWRALRESCAALDTIEAAVNAQHGAPTVSPTNSSR